MRDLLPLTDSMKKRLFQLQVMSLTCIYIRKQNYLPYGLHFFPLLSLIALNYLRKYFRQYLPNV